MASAPNIIYINSHDTGTYIQPYGHNVRTPNLQRLAEQGVLFRHAYSAAPTCSPSRAALCFGQYPHRCGMVGLGNRGVHPFGYEPHLANTLKRAGYDTASWGISDNHLGTQNVGLDHTAVGYDTYLDSDNESSLQKAIDYITAPRDKPFFISMSTFRTHRRAGGFSTTRQPADDPRYVLPPPTLPDTARVREDWAHFQSDAESLDQQMGRVFDAVSKAGLQDRTLIVATTDHGPPFPGLKCNANGHGTGVFLIIRGPGFTGGKVIDPMVSHIDIYPTVCESAGIPIPEHVDGVSLLPLVAGDCESLHDELFAEVSYHACYEPQRAIRTERYVYLRRFGDRLRPTVVNCDPSPSKAEWLEAGYADRKLAEESLYDRFYDPREMNNLARSPEHQHIVDEMRARLTQWMTATNDPLIHGSVPLPESGWENPREDIHVGNRARTSSA